MNKIVVKSIEYPFDCVGIDPFPKRHKNIQLKHILSTNSSQDSYRFLRTPATGTLATSTEVFLGINSLSEV